MTPGEDFDRSLLHTAATHLAPLREPLARADPSGLVSPRSRLLCAGLASLARDAYRALGGRRELEAVGEAAAMLSLLTKIDDEVIDALEFHGGPLAPARERRELDHRTRAYLAPTLASLRAARPSSDEPRCHFAAALGARLRALAGSRERLDHLLDTVAFGWEVQVRAVRLLSSDPEQVDPAAIEAVSADISGAWLLMITMIGELPEDARRPLDARECAAFYRWGLHIQTADALADLAKDTADGLVASRPGVRLAARAPGLWRRALQRGELAPVYRELAGAEIDRACLPAAAQLDALERELAGLGRVAAWLRWIHGFLSWRWLIHPLCPRALRQDELELELERLFPDRLGRELGRGWADGWARWQRTIARAEAGEELHSRQEARPCSAP